MSAEELILIVDDNSYNLKVLGNILRENSYQIAVANNGFEALNFAYKNYPDLILLDIMMPKLDGFEVCKRLKDNQQTEAIPVIFISAITDTKKRLKAFEIGGVDYISKPFHKKEVLLRVKNQLKLRRNQKRLKSEAKKQEEIIKKLKESEKKFRQLAENINEIFFVHSSDFEEMIYINSVYEEILQSSCASLYNNPKLWLEQIHPEDRVGVKETYQQQVKAEAEFKATYRIIRGDGQTRWLKVKAFPVFNQQGEAYRYAGLAEDITEEKRQQEELESRIRLENLIIDLSNRFIDIEKEAIRENIKQGLAKIAKFIEVDYSFLYLFSQDKQEIIDSIKCWQDKFKIEQTALKQNGFNLGELSWLLAELETNNIIDITDINNLPKQAKNLRELLTKQEVKSSLMLPLTYKEDLIGVLGFDAIKTKKDWAQYELDLFKIVADIFSNALQREKTGDKLNEYYNKLEIKNLELERLYNELEAELEKGSKLHQQFLPDSLPELEDISYQAFFQPSSKLGGDFYDAIKLEEEVLFYLADVSGHGLDGAMLNIFLRETINNYLLYNYKKDGEKLNLEQLINYINQKYLEEDFPADYFICLLMVVFDTTTQEFRFVNAGFQFPPFYLNRQGELNKISVQGLPISSAIREHLAREMNTLGYKEAKILFQPGDSLFLTTDGLLEELVGGEQYGEKRLKKLLKKNYQLPNSVIINKLKQDFKDFSGEMTGQDDITFLSFKRDLDLVEAVEFEINSSTEEIYQLQEKIKRLLAKYCPDNVELLIGFQELAINAIEHGNNLDFEKEVLIRVKITAKYLEVIIKDQGAGFSWREKIKQTAKLEDIFVATERGRGIILAQKAYDEVWYNESGNQVHLFKKLEKRGEGNAKS